MRHNGVEEDQKPHVPQRDLEAVFASMAWLWDNRDKNVSLHMYYDGQRRLCIKTELKHSVEDILQKRLPQL